MANTTTIRNVRELISSEERTMLPSPWEGRAVQSEECFSYVLWNTETREALVVDPKREDIEAYRNLARELRGYRWLAVIDTHTHADHVTCGPELAKELQSAYLMHRNAVSPRVQLRTSGDARISAVGAPIEILETPGHTPDSITILWGPYLAGGDTILYGDTGRDDLPGGSPEQHFDSVEKLKRVVRSEQILLPGHDHKGGRASSWRTQLSINSSLRQGREDFVRESRAFDGPAPRLLKESLRENFR